MLRWFDAHLDLAMLAELGRDMTAPPDRAGGPEQPAAITFPSLAQGRVTHCLATIFTEADGPKNQPIAYPAGDAEAANLAGLRQLKRYEDWYRPHFYRRASEHGEQPSQAESAASGAARPSAPPPAAPPDSPSTLAPDFLILIEGADPILDPADLPDWRSRGVVAIGLAWMKPSRYAGGNATDLGLTDLGRALVTEMDRLGVIHDASHLSDKAFWELADATPEVIVASHSNCRALIASRPLDPSAIPPALAGAPDAGRIVLQRHLTDDMIREIARRGGVIGLNLYSPFLIPGGTRARRATIDEAVAHIEHICTLVGDRAHVGLGSDMDGGFSAARLPEAIDLPRDLPRLAEALSARNWPDADIHAFAFGNWARVWNVA